MSLPTTVDEVITRMRAIDREPPADDGARVFNRVYLTVTERIGAILGGGAGDPGPFRDPATMAQLDVRFAGLWLAAYDGAAASGRVSAAWRPLFEARAGGRLPVQYAIAGMNSHIEHDLPVAVVDTCLALGLEPDDVHADYEAVNDVLAEVESGIRRSFLDECGRDVDDRFGPVAHLLSTWNIDKARDLAWVTVETLWALRELPFIRDRLLGSVAHTVGMTSRALLLPIG